ncbi:MAG: L-2-amino-thiazoline-4-carboxylic acid hydrolase [Lachnospiraceae bacterium]|nr:L-2-amino-thiazoline-4-carboxylic acid hydrolase [Lachnospiraceae bacterium]
MGFNERIHAFIAGRYYVRLTEAFGRRGELAFLHATQYYASQRGRRMAQRAIRDGEELTQSTYNYYGEWVNTEEIKEQGLGNAISKASNGDMIITTCPWYSQFRDMGLHDAGELYCSDLDAAISRGFNPSLGYETVQTLHNSDCCIHTLHSGDIFEGSERGKNPAGLKSFEYHCAHIYWAFCEVSEAIFKTQGEEVSRGVLDDLSEDYGAETADIIRGYKDTNFNVCD